MDSMAHVVHGVHTVHTVHNSVAYWRRPKRAQPIPPTRPLPFGQFSA
ncbi:MAG: hypothetical protein ACOX9E_08395 [Lentisphaeria bacterium]